MLAAALRRRYVYRPRTRVRKQYHFRNSERGLLAWDVHRLVELARALPREEVSIATLREIDEPYWFSVGDATPTCRAIIDHVRLIDAADLSFPIVLSADGRIMDGMHRVAKALLGGLSHIFAQRFVRDPEPDHVNRSPHELPY